MFDCYVCGHPILEGQKKDAVRDTAAHPLNWVHLNPADHLPTLDLEPNSRKILREMARRDQRNRMVIRQQERERAVKMVRALIREETDYFIDRNKIGAELVALAQRILTDDVHSD